MIDIIISINYFHIYFRTLKMIFFHKQVVSRISIIIFDRNITQHHIKNYVH